MNSRIGFTRKTANMMVMAVNGRPQSEWPKAWRTNALQLEQAGGRRNHGVKATPRSAHGCKEEAIPLHMH